MKKDRNSFFNEASYSYGSYTPNNMYGGFPIQQGSFNQSFYQGPGYPVNNMPNQVDNNYNTSDIEARISKIERQLNRIDNRLTKLESNSTIINNTYDETNNMYMV